MILVPLTKFKQVFTEFGGLDLFQYGQKTSWDDDYYNKLNEQIKKSGKPSEIASESSAVYGKGVEDFRAGASATRLVVMTLGVFAALFIRLPF